MKALLFTANPKETKKPMKKKGRKARGRRTNPSSHKKSKKSRRFSLNPFKLLSGSSVKGVGDDAMKAGKLVAGGAINKISQLAIEKISGGKITMASDPSTWGSIKKGLLAIGLGMGVKKIRFFKIDRIADETKEAGLLLAAWDALGPTILGAVAPALNLIPGSAAAPPPVGELPPGSRFHLIHGDGVQGDGMGDTVVRDPLPAPSYLGDTYKRESLNGPIISDNAPNRLMAAWEGRSSVYDN